MTEINIEATILTIESTKDFELLISYSSKLSLNRQQVANDTVCVCLLTLWLQRSPPSSRKGKTVSRVRSTDVPSASEPRYSFA